jgi:hypothetical protein
MSTTASIPASRRTPLLSAAAALLATASVTVALALGGGGDTAGSRPSATPATATPDRATIYRNAAELAQPSGPVGGEAAERFHHFR